MLVFNIAGSAKIAVVIIELIFVAGIMKGSAIQPYAAVGRFDSGYRRAEEHRRRQQNGKEQRRTAPYDLFHKMTSFSDSYYSIVIHLYYKLF